MRKSRLPRANNDKESAVIIACTTCAAKYRYDESRFEGKASKRIRCTKCENVFEIHNAAFALRSDGAPESPWANPAPVVVGEETRIRPGSTPRQDRPGLRLSHDSPARERDDGDTTKEYILANLGAASPRQNLRLPAGTKLSLAVISGSDSGRNFPIDKARVVIGRVGSDVPLSDSEISRTHAAIEIEDEIVTLVDLGSTNGTFVDGNRIESAELENYGEFEVGGTTLMLIVAGETL